MKVIFSLFIVCFAFAFCLQVVDSVSAQEKSSRIVIRGDTLRGKADSLAKLWIAPFIDSNRVAKNWSSLRKGLSQQAVRNLLGRSTAIEHDLRNSFSYWWYRREAVVFNSLTRKVAFWDK